MRLSLRAKLFLALLLTGIVTVAATQAFVHWSFQRGLEELGVERRQQRMETIGDRLVTIYEMDGGWQRLRADKRRWIGTLFGRGRHRGFEDSPPGDSTRPNRQSPHKPPHLTKWRALADREPGVWPPEGALQKAAKRAAQSGRPPPLELRLMLLDADDKIVYGRNDLLDQATERYPLLLDEQAIGSLALLPGASVTELADLRFRERQRGHLWLIALGMALLSALIAVPLSALLTRPVRAFQRAMRRLAAGDFGARVALTGRDELGRLGHDVNALAEALERTEQTRRRWVADISHELRTPVALLRADIEAMQDGVRPLGQDALASLHEDTQRLARLVDDLYELSMTDLGALSYRKQRLDLAELLTGELDAFRGQFQNAGLGLTLDRTTAGAVPMDADEQRLSQLFRNLLRNSLRYTDRGGELRVRLARSAHWLRIDFDDSPPGVPEDSLPRLFERLYRVEDSRNRATGGAGLGLAIASNIVEAHGGTIAAEASPLGGLRIRIRLPAKAHPDSST
jgi:two-component system sensor histidine kinase BaeS